MKKNLLLSAICFLLLFTSACGNPDNQSIELTLSPYTSPSEDGLMQNLTIYTYDANKEMMVSSIKSVPLLPEQTRAQASLEYLFSSDEAFSFVKNQNGVYDYRLLQSNQCAIVVINNPCNISDSFACFTLQMSIVNTLANLENISTVTVYAGGKELSGISFLGPLQFYEGNIPSYYQELQSHTPGNPLTSNLFYMDKNSNFLLPETTSYGANPQQLESCLRDMLRRLARGPVNKPDLTNTISADVELLSAKRNGSNLTLDLSISPVVNDTQNPALAYGAIFTSIQSIYPDITSVSFSVAGEPVNSAGDLVFEKNTATLDHFRDFMGTNTSLYFSRKDRKSLTPITRATAASQYHNPAIILDNLLAGPTNQDDAYAVFPKNMSRTDLLSCTISGNTAIVDFKATFFDNCKSLDLPAESVMVYSVVNSLTQMENVTKVQFLIEGQKFETITGNIYYTEPFLENPGLILR